MEYASHFPVDSMREQVSPMHTTLLELVWAVSREVDDDRMVAAIIVDLVNGGRARLTGTFKNAKLSIE